MTLITVIVPFYNSEKFISDCLKSILNQTYTNLEIILVNDGSTDNSLSLCQKLSKDDNRVKILSQPNGGVSSARNLGLDNAHGDFITFVDSDDSICKDMYEKMVSFISSDVDLVCCGINRLDNDGKLLYKSDLAPKGSIISSVEAMRACLEGTSIQFNVYTKLFRARLFNDSFNHVRFPVTQLMEEARILPNIFLNCKSIIHIGEAKYNYYVRGNSYTTKVLNEECFYIYDTIKDYEEKLSLHYSGLDDSLLRWKLVNCMNLYRKAVTERNSLNENVFSRIEYEFNNTGWLSFKAKKLKFRERVLLFETKFKFFIIRKELLNFIFRDRLD